MSTVSPSFSLAPAFLVHKHNPSGNFIEGGVYDAGSETCTVRVRWPDDSSLFRVNDSSDTLLLAETVRQAGIFLGHQFFDVPTTSHFVLNTLHVNVLRQLVRSTVLPDASIDFKIEARKTEHGALRAMALHANVYVADKIVARVHITTTVISSRAYDRLRGDAVSCIPELTLAPSLVEKMPRQPRVSSARHCWTLSVNRGHRALFDHPTDHVAGLVLFEGVRHAVRDLVAIPSADFSFYDVCYQRFIEHDEEITIVLDALSSMSDSAYVVSFTVRGDDRPAMTLRGLVKAGAKSARRRRLSALLPIS